MTYEYIDIVTGDGPPGQPFALLIEVEEPDGRSIRAGEWVNRDDGYRVLRIRPSVFVAGGDVRKVEQG